MQTATQAGSRRAIKDKQVASSVRRIREKYDGNGRAGEGRALVRLGKRTTDVLVGRDDVADWDTEELRQGRRRDKNGNFGGRPPVVVAKAVHDELVKRTLDTANKLLIENLEEALKMLVKIMADDKVDAKDRLTAIKMITDRSMGKEPMNVNVTGEAKWQAAITHSIVSMPAALVDPDIGNRDEGDEDDPSND